MTLQEAKESVAKQYKKSLAHVRKDFEYGMGISKMMSEEEFFDKCAKLYCQSQKAKAIELLYESKLQLEYLDKKFPSTGTTAQVLSEIDTYLIETKS